MISTSLINLGNTGFRPTATNGTLGQFSGTTTVAGRECRVVGSPAAAAAAVESAAGAAASSGLSPFPSLFELNPLEANEVLPQFIVHRRKVKVTYL